MRLCIVLEGCGNFEKALAEFWRGVAFLEDACSVLEGVAFLEEALAEFWRGVAFLEDACSVLEGVAFLEEALAEFWWGVWRTLAVLQRFGGHFGKATCSG